MVLGVSWSASSRRVRLIALLSSLCRLHLLSLVRGTLPVSLPDAGSETVLPVRCCVVVWSAIVDHLLPTSRCLRLLPASPAFCSLRCLVLSCPPLSCGRLSGVRGAVRCRRGLRRGAPVVPPSCASCICPGGRCRRSALRCCTSSPPVLSWGSYSYRPLGPWLPQGIGPVCPAL